LSLLPLQLLIGAYFVAKAKKNLREVAKMSSWVKTIVAGGLSIDDNDSSVKYELGEIQNKSECNCKQLPDDIFIIFKFYILEYMLVA
jgi:hypothetical protein